MSIHPMWSSRWERGLDRLRQIRQREALQAPSPSKQDYILMLVKRWTEKEQYIIDMDRALKDQQAQLREIIEIDIPDAMDEIEIEKLKLPDGSTLSTGTEFIPQYLMEDEYKVYTWMRKNGFAEKLKRTVTVDFMMGEDDLAARFITFLQKHLPGKWKDRTFMHDGTTKVFGREVTEKGLPLPEELTIFPLRRAKIVKARRAKGLEQDGS